MRGAALCRRWQTRRSFLCLAFSSHPTHSTSMLQVARLARKLPQGDLGVLSVQLGGSGGSGAVPVNEEGEEDLT